MLLLITKYNLSPRWAQLLIFLTLYFLCFKFSDILTTSASCMIADNPNINIDEELQKLYQEKYHRGRRVPEVIKEYFDTQEEISALAERKIAEEARAERIQALEDLRRDYDTRFGDFRNRLNDIDQRLNSVDQRLTNEIRERETLSYSVNTLTARVDVINQALEMNVRDINTHLIPLLGQHDNHVTNLQTQINELNGRLNHLISRIDG